MSHETEILELFQIVELSFANAVKQQDTRKRYAQLRDCSRFAGVASCSMGANGDLFRAACLEGVSVEARRLMAEMIPEDIAA